MICDLKFIGLRYKYPHLVFNFFDWNLLFGNVMTVNEQKSTPNPNLVLPIGIGTAKKTPESKKIHNVALNMIGQGLTT
ncbi:MAG: hypothetical protein ACJASQ_003568 [Crocinitomicaceae bacterium]|jgi:hypothetical protein